MKKSKKLKTLESKLETHHKKLAKLEENKFDENGRVDFDCVRKIQHLETEIYYTNKKINFLKQGKGRLGEPFISTNINQYIQ